MIYLSGHATETTLQPENALPVKPWKLEADDTVLLDLLPFLECKTFSCLFELVSMFRRIFFLFLLLKLIPCSMDSY